MGDRLAVPGDLVPVWGLFDTTPTVPAVRGDDETGGTVIARSTAGIVNQGGNYRSKKLLIPTFATYPGWIIPKWDDNGGPVELDEDWIKVVQSTTAVIAAPATSSAAAGEVWVKRNDTREALAYTMTHPDGSIIDLTAATGVTFKMRIGPDTGTLKVNQPGAFVGSRTSGQVMYQWAAGDLDGTGGLAVTRNNLPAVAYDAEFEASFSDGRKITSPEASYITVIVFKDLD